MIAALIEPVTYDRMALLRVILGAGALVLARSLFSRFCASLRGLDTGRTARAGGLGGSMENKELAKAKDSVQYAFEGVCIYAVYPDGSRHGLAVSSDHSLNTGLGRNLVHRANTQPELLEALEKLHGAFSEYNEDMRVGFDRLWEARDKAKAAISNARKGGSE